MGQDRHLLSDVAGDDPAAVADESGSAERGLNVLPEQVFQNLRTGR